MVPFYDYEDGPLAGFYIEGHIDMKKPDAQSMLGIIMSQMPKRIVDETYFTIGKTDKETMDKKNILAMKIAYDSTPKLVYRRMKWFEGEDMDIEKHGGLFDKVADDVDLEQIYYDNCEVSDEHATAITCFSFNEDLIEKLSQ